MVVIRYSKIFIYTLVIALPGMATAFERISTAGHVYQMDCNADGYVLTSKNTVSRAVGEGVNTRYHTDIETIYLGRSCDAFSKILGGRMWCWANGGTTVELARLQVTFARPELVCPAIPNLNDGCRC